MSEPALELVHAAVGLSIQDAGRAGHRRFGVARAGAFDRTALAVANLLVGNPPQAPAVEFVVRGGLWRAGAELVAAVAPAGFAVSIDGAPVEPLAAFALKPGEMLQIGPGRFARGILALAGGVAASPVLGSPSLHLPSGLGSTALRRGDRLCRAGAGAGGVALQLAPQAWPDEPGPFRIILGPQDDHFPPEALAALLESDWTIDRKSDRVGVRLLGPRIEARAGRCEIASDATCLGAIQVTPAGQPIILGPDAGTTGGYPKLACLTEADVARLARRPPGSRLRFAALAPAEAVARVRAHAARLRALADALRPAPRRADLSSARLLSLNLVDGIVAS